LHVVAVQAVVDCVHGHARILRRAKGKHTRGGARRRGSPASLPCLDIKYYAEGCKWKSP
jgi:hypothetical protein